MSGIVSPQERCSAKGYESLSQVEIPRECLPVWWDSCFALYLHKYWSLILGDITHTAFLPFLSYILDSSAGNNKSCELPRDMSTDGSDPQRSTSHLASIRLQPRRQSDAKQCFMHVQTTVAQGQQSDIFRTFLRTSSSLSFFLALKQNNVRACCSSTRCRLQTKGIVTGRSVVGRGVKVSTKGKINRRGHTGASMFRSTSRSGP